MAPLIPQGARPRKHPGEHLGERPAGAGRPAPGGLAPGPAPATVRPVRPSTPEGTRTRSGILGHGRPGVGRVLYETGAPVVPCFHRGLDQVLPIGCVVPRIGKRVDIVIGPPFSVDDLRALPNTKETWQKTADRVMEKIAELGRPAANR